jgi:hypothetical protein
MLHLLSLFTALILAFVPLFAQQRTWCHAEALLVGAILAPGRRTVTGLEESPRADTTLSTSLCESA